MKRIFTVGLVSPAVLFLVFGTAAVAYAQKEQEKEAKPEKPPAAAEAAGQAGTTAKPAASASRSQKQQAKPAQQKPERAQQEPKQQAKPAQQKPERAQQEPKQQAKPAQQKPERAQHEPKQQAKPAQQKPERAQHEPKQQAKPRSEPKRSRPSRQAASQHEQKQQAKPAQQAPQRAQHEQKQQARPAQQQPTTGPVRTAARRRPVPQRTQQQARGWQQQRGWLQQGGGWQGNNSWQQDRAVQWQAQHRTWDQRGGYGGYYIPEATFALNFGDQHWFRITSQPTIVGGYPRFQHDGFWFMLVDPWPEDWSRGLVRHRRCLRRIQQRVLPVQSQISWRRDCDQYRALTDTQREGCELAKRIRDREPPAPVWRRTAGRQHRRLLPIRSVPAHRGSCDAAAGAGPDVPIGARLEALEFCGFV